MNNTKVTLTQNQKTTRLTTSALMIAIGTILSLPFLSVTGPWLNGGSITICAMLPICFIAFKYGVKWGFITGLTHGMLQMLIGVGGLRGINFITFLGAVFIDYLLAYAALCLAGMFKGKIKNDAIAFTLGTFVAGAARFLCHFVSGFVLWGSILQDGFGAISFSFVYNIGYMGPEILLTTAGAAVMGAALIRSGKAATAQGGK